MLENPVLVDAKGNRGVSSIAEPTRKIDEDDADPVWKSSTILDELERFEQTRAALKQDRPYGAIVSVPWLDALTKERCEDELTDISAIYDEVCLIFGATWFKQLSLLTTSLPLVDIWSGRLSLLPHR